MKLLIILLSISIFTSCDLKSASQYNIEAENLENQGKYKEAILLLDKANKKDPNNIYVLRNRAVDKFILEDYKGAIED